MKRRAEPPKGLPHLAQRVFNQPVMITEHKAEVLVEVLRQKFGFGGSDRIDSTALDASAMVGLAGDARRSYDDWKPFHADDGVAVIPVVGTLVHRFGYLDPVSGLCGYDGLAKKFRAAMADSEIRAVWFDIDSPGGEMMGCFSLCEEIAKATQSEGGTKPVWAFINEQATSAAYAVASVCDRVYGPRTMITGSISTYIMFLDLSKALEKNGLNYEVIRGAARKGRMTGTEPLDDPARKKLQAMVDEGHTMFCELVAMARDLTFDEVDGLEGDFFSGPDALSLGLVDGVMSETEAWELLQYELGRAP